MTMLNDFILQLKDEVRARNCGYVQRFEDILARIVSLNDPKSIPALLPFLDDHAEFDEMMFSIIHAIEMFDDRTYVRAILFHVDKLYSQSPRWAVIIHIRIVNSQPTVTEYAEQLKSISDEQRHAVQKVLESVRQRSPRFEEPCALLLAQL